MGTPPQWAIHEALHSASEAVAALRDGLTQGTAVKAAPALRRLLVAVPVTVDGAVIGALRRWGRPPTRR